MSDAYEIISGARDRILSRGWVQGVEATADGVCGAYALDDAAKPFSALAHEDAYRLVVSCLPWTDWIRHRLRIRPRRLSKVRHLRWTVTSYNDAESRTVFDVLAVLNRAMGQCLAENFEPDYIQRPDVGVREKEVAEVVRT